MIVLPTLLCVLLAGPSSALSLVQDEPVKAPQTFTGLAFILEVDLEAGRAAGTLDANVEDAAALEAMAASLRLRLVGSGRFVEGQVAVEEQAQLSVTFVGRQGDALERLLKDGLTNPGRLVYYAQVDEGEALTAERALFDAWTAAHPQLPASAFDGVSSDDGGSASGIVWRPDNATAQPVPLVAATARRIVRADAGFKFGLVHKGETPVGFDFTIGEESLPAMTEYFAAHVGKQMVPVVNGVAMPALVAAAAWDGHVGVTGGLDLHGVRAFLFAFSGEPFPAPVRFVGFDTRPLLNVRTDGIDPEVEHVPLPR